MNFVLVPGAWAGAWLWDDMAKALEAKGHSTHQLTLSGLDEQQNSANISLQTHVEDVHSFIIANELTDVVLVGHSYSGIVVGQVASQFPDLLAHTIFVEAFLPVTGQSLIDVSGLDKAEELGAIAANGGTWPTPLPAELATQPGLSDAQRQMLAVRQQPHPGKTVTDPAELRLPLSELSASFIAREDWLVGSREEDLLQALKTCQNWTFYTIDGGHWPMLTIPQELATLCHSCVM